MSVKRKVLFPVISFGFGLLLFLIMAEVFLRFLPVSTGVRLNTVNVDNPVPHTYSDQDLVWSKNWNFKQVRQIRSNNLGFINPQDYSEEHSVPLTAVIGDSYIEALMVSPDQTFQSLLQADYGKERRVYSFAASGAQLPTYLAYTDYARSMFKPDQYIFFIIGNDYDESLCKYRCRPGNHFFADNLSGEMLLKPYQPSGLRGLLNHSALIRYIVFNLQIDRQKIVDLFGSKEDKLKYVGNTAAAFSPERLEDSKKVVSLFLEQLIRQADVSPKDILFVVDGNRQSIYEPALAEELDKSFVAKMNAYFIVQATLRGFPVVDLHTFFKANYMKDKTPFNSDHDWHWNEYGHDAAFRAVQQSGFLKN